MTDLGYSQRGGVHSALDRILSSRRLGVAAIETVLDDQQSVMVGIENNQIRRVPFNKAITNDKVMNSKLLDLIQILSS